MKRDDTRQKLIDATIHVIARCGLDKATTKQISTESSKNEAYIYHCFQNKEDLFAQTFAFLDRELVDEALQNVPVMYMRDLEYATRCRLYFNSIWRFFLKNKDKCLTFIRYYYSPYFKEYSVRSHRSLYKPLVEKFRDAFLEEADVWMILNYILNVMLDFAIKVFDGSVGDSADTEEHVFRLIYCSVRQYFKNNTPI